MEDCGLCSSCDLRYGEFYHKYFGQTELIIDLAKDHRLILNTVNCVMCDRPYRLDYNKVWFHCDRSVVVYKRRKRCNFNVSIFNNAWFSHSHLDIESNLFFVHLYLRLFFLSSRTQ